MKQKRRVPTPRAAPPPLPSRAPVDRKRHGQRPPTALRPPATFAPIAAPVPPAIGPDLSVDLGRGLVLATPILVASGTFGYGVEYGAAVDVQRLGAICCKGTTLKAR